MTPELHIVPPLYNIISLLADQKVTALIQLQLVFSSVTSFTGNRAETETIGAASDFPVVVKNNS